MKKLCLFIAVVSFTFIVNAQDQPASDVGVNFGVKAGVNFSTIGGDDTSGIKTRTGFHFGAVAEISITEKFSVQPEILYSAQGADYSDGGDKSSYKFDYLNIPVMAKFYVAEGFSLEAGPQIGFLLSAKDDWDYSEGSYHESGSTDLKKFMNGVDIGFDLGVGYKLDNGLNFGARYCLGLSDINDYTDYNGKNHNNVIQISVGYMF